MSNNKRTIIHDIMSCNEFPLIRLGEGVAAHLNLIGKPKSSGLLKLMECYLSITNECLEVRHLNDASFQRLCENFVGALNSEVFVRLSAQQRYNYSRTFIHGINSSPNITRLDVPLSSIGPTENIAALKLRFEQIKFDEEQVWLWGGWPSTNRVGRKTWFRLYPVYQRLGREFTQRLYEISDSYYSGRRASRVVGLSELARFIGQYSQELDASQFRNANFVGIFLREFFSFYIQDGINSKVQIDTLVTNWRNEFLFFAQDYLIKSGLFAEPFGALPQPTPVRNKEHKTHIANTADGVKVKTKLLTHIPLHLTDIEAIELLFKRIQHDINIVTSWAENQISYTWQRLQRRKSLGKTGRVRHIGSIGGRDSRGMRYLVNRDNPKHLANAAASFRYYGYVTKDDVPVQNIFPQPLAVTARELALPTVRSLLPFLALLVVKHPILTPSFLENLELYDRNGRRTGLVKSDAGYKLCGFKFRKGPQTAQQFISLTPQTAYLVLQIIALTAPLRRYLKMKGDDSWRYLLLTSGSAFGYPARIKRIASDTSIAHRVEQTAMELSPLMSGNYDQALALARKMSLPALRASVGVLTYIETKSLNKMAEVLGHEDCSTRLLARYLPPAILEFFQERWIRIFQTGLIVEALKDSPFLLEASSFSTLRELDQFMKVHVLKLPLASPPETSLTAPQSPSKYSEIAIGINPSILTCLIDIQTAVKNATEPVSGLAKYWAAMTGAIINYIEGDQSGRDDLKEHLATARTNSNPGAILPLIYA